MTPLSGLDAAFLYLESEAMPMHVGSLQVYELPRGRRGDFFARARRHLADRLHLTPVFRRRLATLPLDLASPMWVEDRPVDLDYHLQRVVLPPPGTLAALEARVAELHGELLDRKRPLWRFYLFEGLASGQVAWYLKVHHASLDGAAGMQMAEALLDPSPEPRAPPRPRRRPLESTPGAGALVGAALRHAAGQYARLLGQLPELGRVVRDLVGAAGGVRPEGARRRTLSPRTVLNVAITAERRFATASIPLAEVKAIATRHGTTVNDVVLALASGALRRYLGRHGGLPARPLVAAMPVSLRAAGDAACTTRATMVLASLATDVADPRARLAAIRASAGAGKSLTTRARSVIPTDFPTLGAPWLLAAAAGAYGRAQHLAAFPPLANLVISNVWGARSPLYLAGARMLTSWPVSIVTHGLGLNITVQSYCGSLDFGIIAARTAVPDLAPLVRALHAAHDELLGCGRGSGARAGT
ncbi:MAG: wax ester/triacylglycerol synthase family O-acyltransferase [Betaproteobacteria bacterium]|nr:wax ester/triacylglycerol synthase family O-acyltransferase [Betaproteobacteria bacterium]